jgi:LysR family transcriptional regulator, transcriptional activator of nhaA
MNRLNYNQLYYFYVVASEGSVKAASKKLHLTQPTISGQLRTLEDDLGFELFERKHRKLVLNEKGHQVLKRAEKIFLMGEELVNALHRGPIRLRNDLRVGVAQTMSSTFLYDFTIDIWKDPHIKVKVIHGDYRYLIQKMNEDEVDLILSDSPIQPSAKRFKNINTGSQKLVVVGHKKYLPLKKSFPESLNKQPFLSFGLHGQVHSEIEYFFKINNIQPDYVGGSDDLNLNQSVCAKGVCLTVLPENLAKIACRQTSLVSIGELSGLTLNYWVTTSQTSTRKLFVRRAINNFMKKYARK